MELPWPDMQSLEEQLFGEDSKLSFVPLESEMRA